MEKKVIRHTLGICAMPKKIKAPHMQEILHNLTKFDEFILKIFTEDMLFNEDIEKWPAVESMIVFFSNGFPYNKVSEYIKRHKPFLVNDFEMQKCFWDRRIIHKMLEENKISTPDYIIVDRGEIVDNSEGGAFIELNTSAEIEEMIKRYKNTYGIKGEEDLKISSPTNPPNLKNFSLYPKTNRSSSINDNELLENFNNIESFYFNEKENDKNNNESPKNENGIKLDLHFNDEEKDNSLDNNDIDDDLNESDEYVEYKGKKIMKPFVEKPVNGDDHNIYIYYPHGEGQKRLFRKTKQLSSLYYPDVNQIRRDKSYIYEEFLQSDGFDIKVYTVGEDFAHAEARKSPSLDGKVKRSTEGKEIRYPINLTNEEKEIARKIVKIFKQNVCGFDILRTKGKSFVCDVNGWSFVKGNKKYYEDCAIQIRKIILSNIEPELLLRKPINIEKTLTDNNTLSQNSENGEELRSVVAVFRHADRSPKQKLKFTIEEPLLLELFDKYQSKKNEGKKDKKKDEKPKEIKLKKPEELQEVFHIVNNILFKNGILSDFDISQEKDNNLIKFFQIKLILEKNLNFQGMTRKIQLKPLEWKKDEETQKIKITKAMIIVKWGGDITHSGIEQAKSLGLEFRCRYYPGGGFSGEELLRLHSTYRNDLKCYSSEEGRCLKSAGAFLMGLLKLDGNLIPIVRSMVIGDKNVNKLLDVSSSEVEDLRKEVKKNLKNFCNYEKNLKEKYIKEIGKNNINNRGQIPFIKLIDSIGDFRCKMLAVNNLLSLIVDNLKNKLSPQESESESGSYYVRMRSSICTRNIIPNNELLSKKSKDNIKGQSKDDSALGKIVNNKNILQKTFIRNNQKKETVKLPSLSSSIRLFIDDYKDCEDEKIVLIFKRYVKLYEEFYNIKKNEFDISKIPDIYDNIKYDIIHNKSIMNGNAFKLYNIISKLADFTMPLEYGVKIEDKISIGIKLIKPLLTKIKYDLIDWDKSYDKRKSSIEIEAESISESKYSKENKNPWKRVRTRFYFTSQSHLYSLLNTIIYGHDSFLVSKNQNIDSIYGIFNLDYCSHIVFRLFENLNVDEDDDKRYRIEIFISPGANKEPKLSNENHMLSISPSIILNNKLTLKELKKYFNFVEKYEFS